MHPPSPNDPRQIRQFAAEVHVRGSHFVALVFVTQLAQMVPLLGWLLVWPGVYFHEISHGIATIVSNGKFVNFEMRHVGSGVCECVGGWDPIVALAGYGGTALWGLVVFQMAVWDDPERRRRATETFAVAIALSWLLWGKGDETRIMTVSTAAMFAIAVFHNTHALVRPALAFLGVALAADALLGALLLLAFDGWTDAQMLVDATSVPKPVWVVAWSGLAVAVLLHMWRITQQSQVFTSRSF